MAFAMPLYLYISLEFDLLRTLNWFLSAPKSALSYLLIVTSPFFAFLGGRMMVLNHRGDGAIKLTDKSIYASSFFVAPWRRIDWEDVNKIDTFEYKFNPSAFTGIFLNDRADAEHDLSWISRLFLKLYFAYSYWSTKDTVLHVNFSFVSGQEKSIIQKIEHFWGQPVNSLINESSFLRNTAKNSLRGKSPLS